MARPEVDTPPMPLSSRKAVDPDAPETIRLDLRLAELPQSRPGDRVEITGSGPGQAGEASLGQGESVRDRERLVWTVDLRPA
jgi:hypothetical protein